MTCIQHSNTVAAGRVDVTSGEMARLIPQTTSLGKPVGHWPQWATTRAVGGSGRPEALETTFHLLSQH